MKAEGRSGEIQSAVLAEKKNQTKKRYAARELAYVEGSLFDDYIHDMKIVQHFAALNRRAITEVIITGMGFTEIDRFTTVHNYIDTEVYWFCVRAPFPRSAEKSLLFPLTCATEALSASERAMTNGIGLPLTVRGD